MRDQLAAKYKAKGIRNSRTKAEEDTAKAIGLRNVKTLRRYRARYRNTLRGKR